MNTNNKWLIISLFLVCVLEMEVLLALPILMEKEDLKEGWLCSSDFCVPSWQSVDVSQIEPPSDCAGKCSWCGSFGWQCDGCMRCNKTIYDSIYESLPYNSSEYYAGELDE